MTGQELVDQIKQQGFDNTDVEILAWADERQKEMVAEARALRKHLDVGDTVADQQSYDMPPGVAHVYEVSVGGAPYTASPHTDIAAANQQDLVWLGNGLFVADSDSDGVDQIALIPTPTEAGSPIDLYAAVEPDDLTLGGTVFVPRRFIRYLRAGAIATGWDLNAEDARTADRYESQFETGKEVYRRWANRRFRGSGPAQIRVKGLNA